MPSTAFLGLPLAHYTTFYFRYSFLLIPFVCLLFIKVSRAHSLILQVIIFLPYLRFPEMGLLTQFINLI